MTEVGSASEHVRRDSAGGPAGWVVLATISAVILILDQFTKSLVVQHLAPQGPGYYVPVVGDFLRLAYTTNTGSAFGFFPDRTGILTVFAMAAVPAIILFHKYLPLQGWTAKICAGLLLGGATGNLADRLRQGYVVDFVSAGFGNLRWPSFNVADSSFVIGVLLILLFVALTPEPKPRRDEH